MAQDDDKAQRMMIYVPVNLEVTSLAETMADATSYATLVELVHHMDEAVGEWAFTFKLAEMVLGLLAPYAQEIRDPGLAALIRDLRERLERIGQEQDADDEDRNLALE
jgi:hypothetical protein